MDKKKAIFDFGKLKVPITLLIAFCANAAALWQLFGCIACYRMSPMDIKISHYAQAHKRVLSSECILSN